MDRLYELFVAEWLKVHLPERYFLKPQEHVRISDDGSIFFRIDLVLYDLGKETPLCVLDTKYKKEDKPSTNDIAKVSSYATSKCCLTAFLVYPSMPAGPHSIRIGDCTIRCLSFPLDNDLDANGEEFMTRLLEALNYESKEDYKNLSSHPEKRV